MNLYYNCVPPSPHPPVASPPADYDEVYKRYAAQGARVIALARKKLPDSVDASMLRSYSREEVESGLDFCGFAVFSCPLKPESEPALQELLVSTLHLLH